MRGLQRRSPAGRALGGTRWRVKQHLSDKPRARSPLTTAEHVTRIHISISKEEMMLPVPQIPGGLVVSIVGIINGAINGIAPQVLALLATLGLAPPV